MSVSQRLLGTLGFENMNGEGAVLETFYPWNKTVASFIEEGLPLEHEYTKMVPEVNMKYQRYFSDTHTQGYYAYEQYLGFDGVKRMAFRIPFQCFDEKIIEEQVDYALKLDKDGWERAYYKTRDLVKEVKPVISTIEDWNIYRKRIEEELALYCTDENLETVYGKYSESHKSGAYSIRFRASGFFWTSRELLGIEEQLIAFYDDAELIHEINEFVLKTYLCYFDKIFDYIQPEVILFEEDLSGVNGPMISGAMFDEFVGKYYKELIPFLKKKGVKNIFVDTDGDFRLLIPNFLAVGVDGFLPMDVNAGMDIVEVRRAYPNLKFIGAYNKLRIEEGKEAIDKEFERLLPVIKGGGYVPGADHQVTPHTSLENYKYYINKLKDVMRFAGCEL